MKAITPGFHYELDKVRAKTVKETLLFYQEEKGKMINDGTTLEEVIMVLMDKLILENTQNPMIEGRHAFAYLREARKWIQKRKDKMIVG